MHVPRPWVLALIEEGLLERLIFGVHRDPAQEVPDTQCLHLALRYLEQRRPDHRLPEIIGGTAALGVRGVTTFSLPRPPLVLTHSERRPRKPHDLFTTLRCDLSRVPHEQVRGVTVADVPLALAHAADEPDVTGKQLRLAVDDLRGQRMLDLPAAARQWATMSTRGARRLLQMVADGDFEQESEGERDAFRRLFATHPPAPDCQVWLTPSIRVDFLFIAAALVVEYHGGDHDYTVDKDSTRGWALRNLGCEVIAVTKSMMRDSGGLAAGIHRIRVQREHLIASGHLRPLQVPAQPPRLSPLRTFDAA